MRSLLLSLFLLYTLSKSAEITPILNNTHQNRHEKKLITCQQIEPSSQISSAARTIDPIGYAKIYVNNKIPNNTAVFIDKKPQHGDLIKSESYYIYTSYSGYYGNDDIVFTLKLNNKTIKVQTNLVIVEIADDSESQTTCKDPYIQ